MEELGLPMVPGTFSTLGIRTDTLHFSPALIGLEWSTHNDWLQLGNARFRVYRIDVSLLGKYSARIFISHIGEILRAELPNKMVLSNDALMSL